MNDKEDSGCESITVGGIIYHPIYSFDVTWHKWDCDYVGYIAKDPDGKNVAILSNHWQLYVASKEDLQKKLEEYRSWIKQTKTALGMLE